MEDKPMKFGFIPTEGGHYYPEFLEEATYGEELGFDSVWLEEHHGVKDHYWPSPLMGLTGLATRTERILLGTDILILPFYHPVRTAEDSAMLDIISKGRFIFGAAIGYKPDEFSLYQIPMEKRGERFEEAIKLIKLLWTQEEVSFEGKHYQVKGLKIEPRPVSKPHPKIWLGGWGNLSLSRAALLGDAWVPGPTASLEKLLEAQRYYQEKLNEAGIPVESRERPLTREVIIANSEERAYELAEKHLLVSYRDEYGTGRWKHPLIGKEDSAPVATLDAINRDRFIIGNPETVIKQIQHFSDCFHMDHLICRLYFPGMPHVVIMEELTLLAREVIPAFTKQHIIEQS
jgi:alkanesulfonate monooxygenase SsuD/methylene tetrahydromethanopterin reductase-like flavin-dependent oxidoreductase (luciferase family)